MVSTRLKRSSNPAAVAASPVVRITRGIKEFTRLLLVVRAGGRCEFDDHNEYLLHHPLTLTPGIFGQMAHIVAFREDGPRGKSPLRPAYINDISNLMLLCPQCHKLIDDHPDKYPVTVLQKYKESHEDRVFHVTGLGPDKKTTVLQLKARIAGQTVAIPVAQVTKAVAPRYPTDAKGHLIDLTAINSEGKAFIEEACRCIKQRIERLYEPGMDVHETRHISLFALAPIPLLIYLGSQLSNKVPVDVFQRHRDTEDWVWKDSGTPADYRFDKIREGRLSTVTRITGRSMVRAQLRIGMPPEIEHTMANTHFFKSIVEPYVRDWLTSQFGVSFRKEFLPLASDRQIVAGSPFFVPVMS